MDKDYNSIYTVLTEEIKKENSSTIKAKLLYILNNKALDEAEKKCDIEDIAIKHKYDLLYRDIDNKINEIINSDQPVSISQEDKAKYNISDDDKEITEIKDYWTKALINCGYFTCNPRDCEILKYLRDMKIKFEESNRNITVEFTFDENPYFSNEKITKMYEINKDTDILIKAKGSEIHWKKKLKDKRKNRESFFDIFKSDYETTDEEVNFIRDDFFMNHLGYYLNIIEFEEEGDDEEEEDEDDSDDDSSSDEDYEEEEEQKEQKEKEHKTKKVRRIGHRGKK